MSTIYVVRGTGTGPTAMASYDAALADAGVHNYNLVTVSSIVPADAEVVERDVAPDLGPAGNRLTVVQARDTAADRDVAAGLGWATGPGPGLFYEASGPDPSAVRAAVTDGLAAGRTLREEWTFTDEHVVVERATPREDEGTDAGFVTSLVVAAYGESEPIL